MYRPGAGGREPPGDKVLMSAEMSLSFHSFVASFKKMSSKSDFIHFFFFFMI